jgi:hypothetical protein
MRAHASHRIVLGLAAALFVASVAAPAEARPHPRAAKFEANKSFGLGLMLGEPSGLSGKYFLTKDTALDFGVGYLYHYRDRDGLHLHADFLWHPAVLTKNESFWLPIYFGVGARFFDHHDYGSALGLRVPGGIAFDFQRVPIDIFFEIWFAVDLIYDDNYDRADGGASIGIRYYV